MFLATQKQVVQTIVSTFVSLLAVAAGGVVIAYARRWSAVASAVTISILNQVTPRVCMFINNRTESHSSDGSRQASLYVKMTFFRWVNTVVRTLMCSFGKPLLIRPLSYALAVLQIITIVILPFSDSVTDGKNFLINSVYAIFFSELLVTPLMQLSDAWGNFQRHFMGPRSADQKRMNLKFRGAYFQLAERFTVCCQRMLVDVDVSL